MAAACPALLDDIRRGRRHIWRIEGRRIIVRYHGQLDRLVLRRRFRLRQIAQAHKRQGIDDNRSRLRNISRTLAKQNGAKMRGQAGAICC